MPIQRLRAQCLFEERSCDARLLCACGGEACRRLARRWEELCHLLGRLVVGDLLAWLRLSFAIGVGWLAAFSCCFTRGT